MAIQSTIMLNNGTVIPQVGLGVFQTPDGDTTVNAVADGSGEWATAISIPQ